MHMASIFSHVIHLNLSSKLDLIWNITNPAENHRVRYGVRSELYLTLKLDRGVREPVARGCPGWLWNCTGWRFLTYPSIKKKAHKNGFDIYRRFSESTNFCSKERLLRPVVMILGYVKNRQPVQFHSHPGQGEGIVLQRITGCQNPRPKSPLFFFFFTTKLNYKVTHWYYDSAPPPPPPPDSDQADLCNIDKTIKIIYYRSKSKTTPLQHKNIHTKPFVYLNWYSIVIYKHI